MRILVMGLSGSGKTTLCLKLKVLLKNIIHLNADEVRKSLNDWDFSVNGRLRQASRLRMLANDISFDYLIDTICPFEATRGLIEPHKIILMNTIASSKYDDTDRLFTRPINAFEINTLNYKLDSVIEFIYK